MISLFYLFNEHFIIFTKGQDFCKHFIISNLYNLNNPMGQILFLSQFYRLKRERPNKLCTPKSHNQPVTELRSEHPGLISFRMDWLALLAVQGTLKSLLQHHSSKASILRHSAFFTVQLSHDYWGNQSLD